MDTDNDKTETEKDAPTFVGVDSTYQVAANKLAEPRYADDDEKKLYESFGGFQNTVPTKESETGLAKAENDTYPPNVEQSQLSQTEHGLQNVQAPAKKDDDKKDDDKKDEEDAPKAPQVPSSSTGTPTQK